jgi:CheY-like chemotaxis protein
VDTRAGRLHLPTFCNEDGAVEQPLKDRSVLIVEDDVVLATDLAVMLTAAGCKAVVPTTSVPAALSTIVHYVVDAAILDVNVQNEWVFPVAHALERAGIPFVFLTAYSLDSIPAEHRGKAFIQKPHVPQDLLENVVRVLGPPQPGVKLATVDGAPVSDSEREPPPERSADGVRGS